MSTRHESIVVLDFGSQYTRLIARRIREQHVFCEILVFDTPWPEILAHRPHAIILSGGPQSVSDPDSPRPDPRLFDFKGPILGICYGMQLLARRLGGRVQPAPQREYGRAVIEHGRDCLLFDAIPSPTRVWMSHGDRVLGLPPGFRTVATTSSAIAAMENRQSKVYGLQFHPEVAHTTHGEQILSNFLFRVCHCRGDWTMASFIDETVNKIRERIGEDQALCALSGGVDSTVAAVLVQKSIGDRLSCLFVDNGLLRKGESDQVLATFKQRLQLKVKGIGAASRFLRRLKGVTDPERKRKAIGAEFIRVFEEEARRLGNSAFLVQGTLYPDVIESVSVKGPAAVIKSHHNVGGLPARMNLKLVEPLRELFKDEVRRVGRKLGLPQPLLERQPFPGPGLAVRIIGEVTAKRLAILREADQIVLEEIKEAGLYSSLWQSFAVLLPVQSVGVMGDGRTYENAVAIRAVHSLDGMTADWAPLPTELLGRISNRIVNQVRGINRVVYDITSKPPGTIEWE
ncbi:MAG: glutamine-hydrolyzing GMP synthase [Acidobacteriota bacterium]